MSHAWLDDLSEDWPSQPASPERSKTSTRNGTATSSFRSPGTKIPQPLSSQAAERKFAHTSAQNSSVVLNERTPSDINIPVSSVNRNTPSKLSREIRQPSWRGHRATKSDFESPAGSVVHNTVQHRSSSSSPGKDKGNTPEWRRRLIHGDFAYGEQRDLFTSAANGLEGMFKPPVPSAPSRASFAQPAAGADEDDDDGRPPRSGITIPSSPPAPAQKYTGDESYSDQSTDEELPVQEQPSQPRSQQIRYRLNDEASVDFSQNSVMSSPPRYSPGRSSQLSPFSRPLQVPDNGSRRVSNQSAAQHEDFSPILIAKKSSDDGKIDFEPVGFSPSELQQRLEKLRVRPSVSDSEEDSSQVVRRSRNSDAAEDSKELNSFVNARGGGPSDEYSFLHHPVPSGFRNVSDMFPESSLQASTPKQFPSIRIHEPDSFHLQAQTPSVPAAPFPSPEKKALQAAVASSSPLKLFGPYDTFTNKTFQARIEQIEKRNASPGSEHDNLDDERKVSVDMLRHMVQPASPKEPLKQPTRSFSQFGAGELDGYAFKEDFTRLSNDSGDGSIVHHSVSFEPPTNFSPPPANNIVIGKRRQKSESTPSTQGTTTSREFGGRPMQTLPTPSPGDLAAEIKRHRTSPTKNPTPKRRRTLHQSDIAFGVENDLLLEPPYDTMPTQLLVGKRRKDAGAGDKQRKANGNLLASRQLPRPRTPTPSQPSSLRREVHRSPDSFLEQEIAKLPRKPQTQVASTDERKPSIRTEDYLNAAHRIMAALRRKTGLPSGSASLEESEEEFHRNFSNYTVDNASIQDSTREKLSRPPSREGQPIPRAAKRQEDPILVNHLKQYEEHSDMDDIIAASLRSLGVSKEDIKAVKALEEESRGSRSENSDLGMLEDSVVVSHPPFLPFSRNTNRYENSTAAEQVERFRGRFPSNTSGSESGYSTVRTGSSRNSDTRRTIAPESVSHLIPDQVGSMVLDKERNVWVKARVPQATRHRRSSTLLSENSDDDPFADIPDLTVDVSKELQNLRDRMAQGAANARATEAEMAAKGQGRLDQSGILKPILVRDSGDRLGKNSTSRTPSRLIDQFVETDDEDVEKEITIHNDRLDEASPKRRPQVNFSSPVSIVIQDAHASGGMSDDQDASVVEPIMLNLSQPKARNGGRNVSFQSINNSSNSNENIARPRSSSSAPSRHMPVQGENFVPQPVSVIEEQDEDSQGGKAGGSRELSIVLEQSLADPKLPNPKPRQTSLSILVTTPARPQAQPRPENAEIIGHYVGDLSLTPLPDFTAHQDQSYALEVSYVLGDHNLVTGDGSKQHMSQAVRHLVDKIAEVEAFEPFWEDMKEIELRDKNLDSLHMLDRFCGRLVRVDASQNSIRALDGIPSSVRELKVSHNMLSDLSAWDRLANLQYVDISGNKIRSLSSFRNLVHLRDLIADNTGLANLDGIKYHEALLTIRARGNDIEEVDFDGTCLQRLASLDLEGNKIRQVENLHELSSLSYLNLRGNQMVEFAPKENTPLKHLVISDNKLRSLDVTAMASLHTVYADRNKLTTVHGLRHTRHLDTLSLREQGGSRPFDMATLARAYEVRKLFLSGNRLGLFSPPRNFLNLQLLDLANCGLQRLPDDLGQMMPNLRVLNLNFNGFSDISGILGIPRLKRLFLAGNRFADLKSLLKILAEFPSLAEVDLRDTFLTQGFYPTVQMVIHRNGNTCQPAIDPFRLPDADAGRDAKFCCLLDMDTRIQRRTYERKMVKACAQLQKLDGLSVDKRVRHVKDIVWRTMVERGLLLRPDGSPFDLSMFALDEGPSSSYIADVDSEKSSNTLKGRREG
ncbi:hypothetical protein M406DRAFT_256989 [Cryphonectria parasitica EP155]|uniref:Septation initiation network scaffold protein cdc11 n=1 Tax=Cryphonectria parasitica (strain ATCC 38755 / EP155) TaxID=660469 RepID=A0A9P5CP23_CRYP1|nr:uncharacterized protein M406DRAFT_256989 [Cryphonectria parasitica EP155]KAF3766054.1 hypothetical protein M406DRAFT_256989 [Cryphonectria parasitica EP155]